MNTSSPRIRYIVYILPVIAVAVMLRQYMAQDGIHEAGAQTSSVSLRTPVIDNGPPSGKAIYKYAINGGPTPPAAFFADAPCLADGAIGDSMTGYLASSDAVPAKDLCVLIDLGNAAPSVREWEFAGEFRGSTGNAISLSANDSPFSGAWTSVDRVEHASPGRVSGARRISPARHRYWLIEYQGAGPGASIMALDARLIDHGGHVIGLYPLGTATVKPAISRNEAGRTNSALRTGRLVEAPLTVSPR